MSEEVEGQDTGAEAVAGGVDPAAVAIALGGASREDAGAFLKKQGALIDDQRHHLHEQLKHLHLGIWEKRLGVLLRVATAAMGIGIAAGLAFMVWDASQSNGLLIEPFSVPPDLAGRGLTGEVVSAKLLDRLMAMQAQTSSQRAPKSYANNWDEKAIKLDVPESGVSLNELDQFLREELGHDTHLTGEVVRTASGLSLTARAGLNGADSVSGPDADMDALVQRLAESIYRMTQPYRYAAYLSTHDRKADAVPILQTLAKTSPADRPWAYNVLALGARETDGLDAGLRLLRRSMSADPDLTVPRNNISRYEIEKGLPEQALRENRQIVALSTGREQHSVLPKFVPAIRQAAQAQVDLLLGDFNEAAQEQAAVIQSGIPGRWGLSADLALAQADDHDLAAARATMADPVPESGLSPGSSLLYKIRAQIVIDSQAQDWAGVLSVAYSAESQLEKYPGEHRDLPTTLSPFTAYAQAMLGDVAAAERRIALSPMNCYDCLITRARIAELRSQHESADGWFARAVQQAPSIPFAYYEWGRALLARGKPDEAIENFKSANQRGPDFADPLEGWGEALMAKNQSHLALAKFEAAEKYAPNWGRLHLKWGEALMYAGKKDEARAQYQKASTLDLTAVDKAALRNWEKRT